MSARLFAVKLIGLYIRNIRRTAPEILSGKSGEALHQLRVNLRRLRNALWMFRGFFSEKKRNAWTRSTRVVMRCSSPLRDMDVYINYLNLYKRQLGNIREQNVLDELIRDAQKRRKPMLLSLTKAVNEFQQKKVLEDISNHLKSLLARRIKNDPLEIYRIFRKKISKRIRQLLAFDAIARQPTNSLGLHQTRIAAKHLRYSLEGGSPFLKRYQEGLPFRVSEIYDSRINVYIERVLGIHRRLGVIHDYDVWLTRVDQFARIKRLAVLDKSVVSGLKKYSKISREKEYKKFAVDWDELKRDRFFEDLMEYVFKFEI